MTHRDVAARKERLLASLRLLAARNYTRQELVSITGAPYHDICWAIKRLGIKAKYPPRPQQAKNPHREAMQGLRRKGWTLDKIGVKFGVSRERVRQLTPGITGQTYRQHHGLSAVYPRAYRHWAHFQKRHAAVEAWRVFATFAAWWSKHETPGKRFLWRRDILQPFGPQNCFFKATRDGRPTEAGRQAHVAQYTAFGKTLSLEQWLKEPECSIGYSALRQRIQKLHWPLEDALSLPLHAHHSTYFLENRNENS